MSNVRTLCTLALTLIAGHLQAALEFTLTPSVKSGALGTEITFSGTLRNTSTTDNLFLNDIQFTISGASATALTPDSNSFFANVPGLLLPNEIYTGPIFTILLKSTAAPGDYSGSVAILGGADILATTTLQTQSFQISSPSISVVATTANANEFGPQAGIFTVSRSGAVNYDLVVNYTIAGSAIPGVRYSPLSGSLTILDGAATATVNVTPIPNDTAEGNQTVLLTISPSPGYNVGAPSNATVTIHDKPIDEWRLAQFGANANVASIAGDLADPEKDGMLNLTEYGLFSNPNVSSTADLPSATIGSRLQLNFHRNTAATDITYIVEARSDLNSGNWEPQMTRAPGTGWTANAAGATAMESGSGNFVSVVITDSIPFIDPNTSQPLPKRFIRLRLVR